MRNFFRVYTGKVIDDKHSAAVRCGTTESVQTYIKFLIFMYAYIR